MAEEAGRVTSLEGEACHATRKFQDPRAVSYQRFARFHFGHSPTNFSARHNVTEPWRVIFDVKGGDSDVEAPSHRYLFHCYVYQYHLMRFSTMIMELVRLTFSCVVPPSHLFDSSTKSFVSRKNVVTIGSGPQSVACFTGTGGNWTSMESIMMRKIPIRFRA
jgi:hypothetical protein